MREKDWRCRVHVTPVRLPWRAHIASPFCARCGHSSQNKLFLHPYIAQANKHHHNKSVIATAGYLSFQPMIQCVMHALKGLACRARVTPASSPASHCKQYSALTSPSLHAWLRQSFSRTLRSQFFSMGPKLRYPVVLEHKCLAYWGM